MPCQALFSIMFSHIDVLGRGAPPCHIRSSTKEYLLAFVQVPPEPPRINMDRPVQLFIMFLRMQFLIDLQEFCAIDIWLCASSHSSSEYKGGALRCRAW